MMMGLRLAFALVAAHVALLPIGCDAFYSRPVWVRLGWLRPEVDRSHRTVDVEPVLLSSGILGCKELSSMPAGLRTEAKRPAQVPQIVRQSQLTNCIRAITTTLQQASNKSLTWREILQEVKQNQATAQYTLVRSFCFGGRHKALFNDDELAAAMLQIQQEVIQYARSKGYEDFDDKNARYVNSKEGVDDELEQRRSEKALSIKQSGSVDPKVINTPSTVDGIPGTTANSQEGSSECVQEQVEMKDFITCETLLEKMSLQCMPQKDNTPVVLGKGSFGTVFKVKVTNGKPGCLMEGGEYAAKVMHMNKVPQEDTRHEVAVGQCVKDVENVLGIDWASTNGEVIVMKIAGQELKKYIANNFQAKPSCVIKGDDKCLEELEKWEKWEREWYTEAMYIFEAMLVALQGLNNKGIAHHDIKPANILYDENKQLRLMDWGVSCGTPQTSLQKMRGTACNNINSCAGEYKKYGAFGTPDHMDPDLKSQLSHSGTYNSHLFDIFATGLTILDFLEGGEWRKNEPMFQWENTLKSMTTRSQALQNLQDKVEKAKDKVSEDRYIKLKSFQNAVVAALSKSGDAEYILKMLNDGNRRATKKVSRSRMPGTRMRR